MASSLLTKEVLLDISVNIIPLFILGAFLVLFVAITPWGIGFSLGSILQISLIGLPFVGLALLTYIAAKKIET